MQDHSGTDEAAACHYLSGDSRYIAAEYQAGDDKCGRPEGNQCVGMYARRVTPQPPLQTDERAQAQRHHEL